jgi:alkanesulfonate monooxygenase SsuD/methylene tetrahydromethanopterin reductase-like flavin-dependent oxidoreductase (luciferase family)
VAAVRTEETYAWAGANGFDLLTAPFFFPDHRDQQRLLAVYRDNLIAHGHDPARKEVMAVIICIVATVRRILQRSLMPRFGATRAFQGDRSPPAGLPRSNRLQGLEGLLRKP